jgi:hypothetical protein
MIGFLAIQVLVFIAARVLLVFVFDVLALTNDVHVVQPGSFELWYLLLIVIQILITGLISLKHPRIRGRMIFTALILVALHLGARYHIIPFLPY